MIYKAKFSNSLLLIFILYSFSVPQKIKLNIVFIGDSITFGSGLTTPASSAPPVHACAFLLQKPTYRDVEF